MKAVFPDLHLPRWVWAVLLGALIAQLTLATQLELSPDEAYYWTWAKNLQLSYFDHPPLIAWMIAMSTAIFGDSAFGVRFFAPLALFVTALLLAGAVRDLGGDRRAICMAALMPPLTLAGQVIALIILPDAFLLFSSALLLAALARFYRTGFGNLWIVAGIACGIALLAKYTAFALGFGILLWLEISPKRRREFLRWQLWAGGAIAIAIFSPVLVWNVGHEWASFAKQGSRTLPFFVPSLKTFTEFLGAQFGLITPLMAILLVYAMLAQMRLAYAREDRAVLLCSLSMPLVVYLAYYSIGVKTEANWAAASLPALFAMTALTVSEEWDTLKNQAIAAFALAGLMSCTLLIYAASTFESDLGRRDILQRLSGHADVVRQIGAIATKEKACLIVAGEYTLAALLIYHLHGQVPAVQINQPERYEGISRPDIASCSGKPIIAVASQRIDGAGLFHSYFENLELLSVVQRFHRGVLVEKYDVWRVKSGVGP